MRTLSLTAVLLSVVASACSHAVRTSRFDGKQADGIVYSLPRKVLDVTVTYTVRAKSVMQHGVVGTPTTSVVLQKPITITERLVADTTNRFVLSGEKVSDNIFLESNLNLTWDDHGVLTAMDVETTDKTLDALQSLVSAGVQAARVAAVAGAGDGDDARKRLQARINALYLEAVVVSESRDPKKRDKLKALNEELAALQSLLAKHIENNKEVVVERDVSYTLTVDPESTNDCKRDTAAHRIECTIRPDRLIEGVSAASMPELKIVLEGGTVPAQNGTYNLPANTAADGIIYRVPVPMNVRVSAVQSSGETTLLSQLVAFPQYGGFAVAPAGSKAMSTRTTKLAFSATTGSLRTLGAQSGSSADRASSALQTALTTVQQGVLDARYNLALQRLELEKKLKEARGALQDPAPAAEDPTEALKQEKALLDAQLELEKARRALEDFRKAGQGQ